MADDFDVEAMLEAPYRKEDDGKPDGRSDKERRCQFWSHIGERCESIHAS